MSSPSADFTWRLAYTLSDWVNWRPIQDPEIDCTSEEKLRPVEKFRFGDKVIYPAKKLRGTVQNSSGWKEVAQVYAVQCLWQWETDELKG